MLMTAFCWFNVFYLLSLLVFMILFCEAFNNGGLENFCVNRYHYYQS